jgi:hypothetical protein
MIDFILSKLGILIFAISMASILLFFSMSVKDVFLADQTVQVSNIIAKQIKYMSESDTLCSSKRVLLPKYIDIFGISDKATFTPIYYGIKISKVKSDGSQFVVFNIYNKRTGKSIGLESFKTNANLVFSQDSKNQDLDVDPTLNQVLYLVKNSYSESDVKKTNIYFISCKYDRTALGDNAFKDCYDKLNLLNTSTFDSSTGEKFYCVPNPNFNNQSDSQ